VTEAFESLAARAERAVLGAVLLRPDVFQEIAYLDPAEFADPAHAALFGSIRAELARDPDQAGSTLSANLDSLYAATGHSPDYEALAAACPHPGAVAAYARMLVEADFHRTMRAEADRLAEISEPNSQSAAEAVALDRGDVNASTEAEEAPIPGSWKGSQPNREERVLADLIQHPGELDQLPALLGPEHFSAEARSLVFDAIREVHRRGESVDKLTVAWEVDRLQHTVIGTQVGVDPAAYVDRLAALPVEPGTAAELTPRLADPAETAARLSADLRQKAAAHGYGSRARERAIDRQVGRGPNVEPEYRPPTYQPPSPEPDRGHGPRLGF